MSFCPKCRTKYIQGAKFCYECGGKVEQKRAIKDINPVQIKPINNGLDIEKGQEVYFIRWEKVVVGTIERWSFSDVYYVLYTYVDDFLKNTFRTERTLLTYKKDFFLTQEEAEKELEKRLPQIEERKKEYLRKLNYHYPTSGNASQGWKNEIQTTKICKSCSLPIGKFGHCGCSH